MGFRVSPADVFVLLNSVGIKPSSAVVAGPQVGGGGGARRFVPGAEIRRSSSAAMATTATTDAAATLNELRGTGREGLQEKEVRGK